ncbi:MAG: hypothetical protein WAT81_02395 [Candidatus Moraniibacteriota bacterium]
MTKLYLDIDGVLLRKDGTPAEGLVEFLSFVTNTFECYWLTTHCDGDSDQVFLYLVGLVPSEALPFIEKIRPTRFGALKTEGIDFTGPFYWLDDTVFESEQSVLARYGVVESFLHVDINQDPQALRKVEMLLAGVE